MINDIEEIDESDETEVFPEGWSPPVTPRYNAVRSRHLFPIRMWEHDRVKHPDFPRYIPWSMAEKVMPELSVVRLKSGMSMLDVLAATGGISYREFYYKLTGQHASEKKEKEIIDHVESAIAEYIGNNPQIPRRTTSPL